MESAAKRTKTGGEAEVTYRILALYRFVPLATPEEAESAGDSLALSNIRTELLEALRRHEVKGTLLIAPEGINGTISYPWPASDTDSAASSVDLCVSPDESLTQPAQPDFAAGKQSPSDPKNDDDPVHTYLTTHTLFGGPKLRTRISQWSSSSPPFHRLKVKSEYLRLCVSASSSVLTRIIEMIQSSPRLSRSASGDPWSIASPSTMPMRGWSAID